MIVKYIPRDKFWNYVLYICHVGDLSLLEKLLSQYRDQPVQLNFSNSSRTEAAVRSLTKPADQGPIRLHTRCEETCRGNGDKPGSESCQSQVSRLTPPRIPARVSSLGKRQRQRGKPDFLLSAPSLPNAMLQAAILGRQLDIVDYLVTEFRWFLSIDDAIMHAILIAADIRTLRALHNHYPRVVNYRFRPVPSSMTPNFSYVQPAPRRGPSTTLLEMVMSKGHAYHDFVLFLVEKGALLDTQSTTPYGTLYQAILTRQPLSVLQACLKRGVANICMATIELAVRNNDHEALDLIFSSSRPTREEVSDKEIMHLAAHTPRVTEDDSVLSCARMLKEYILARQIHSRVHTKKRRMSSSRSISVLGIAGSESSTTLVAELECPMAVGDSSEKISLTRPPSYTSCIAELHETHGIFQPEKPVTEHTWFHKKRRTRSLSCAMSDSPRLESACSQISETWYEEASPLIECTVQEDEAEDADDDLTKHSTVFSRATESRCTTRTNQESIAAAIWDRGKMASSTTVHSVQSHIRRTRASASRKRESIRDATDKLRKSFSSFF